MVEFVRDVMIAVAVLATLIAFAVHPTSDFEPLRHGSSASSMIAIAAPADAASSEAVGGAAPPK